MHLLESPDSDLPARGQCVRVSTSLPHAAAGLPAAVPAPLARVLAYIEHNACQPLRLEQLASIACLSVCRFVRVFHRQFGLPPHRYICHVRIERVKALLRAGVAPAVVAGETGFYDQSHLSRHFKNVCGMTPGQYLSQLRAQSVPTPGFDPAATVPLHCDDIEAAPCHANGRADIVVRVGLVGEALAVREHADHAELVAVEQMREDAHLALAERHALDED